MQAAGDSIEHRIVCQLQGNPAAPPPEFQLGLSSLKTDVVVAMGQRLPLLAGMTLVGSLSGSGHSPRWYGAPLIRVALFSEAPSVNNLAFDCPPLVDPL